MEKGDVQGTIQLLRKSVCLTKLVFCEKVDFPPQAGSALAGRDIMGCGIGRTCTALGKKLDEEY